MEFCRNTTEPLRTAPNYNKKKKQCVSATAGEWKNRACSHRSDNKIKIYEIKIKIK